MHILRALATIIVLSTIIAPRFICASDNVQLTFLATARYESDDLLKSALVPVPNAVVGVTDVDDDVSYFGVTDSKGEWSIKLPVGHFYNAYVDPPFSTRGRCHWDSINGFYGLADTITHTVEFRGDCTGKRL